jgi:glycosyltransferase involved in cell wall biosynthesis
MKIAFIQDFNFFQNVGGAESSDLAVFTEGVRRGHNMTLVNPESMRTFNPADYNLLIISNTSHFPIQWLLQITQTTPYVMYNHDYLFLCNYRLFYPMLNKCKKCKNIPNIKKLLMNSVLNIFLSPLHLDSWCFAIPEVKDHPYHLHPSPIDLELFNPNPEIKRNPNAGLVINAAEFKGSKNTVEYCKQHPEITFTFCGGQPQGVVLSPNCVYVGYVPTQRMPEMYNQASYFVELPDTPQPCERQVIEARLMGVPHIVINKNIGVASYDWFKEDIVSVRKHIQEAVPIWWKKVEEMVK